MHKQTGFAAFEFVLLAVVVAVLGFTAYNYLGHKAVDSTGSVAVSANVPSAPQVKSTKDLDTAATTLDQVNVDENTLDSTQLDAELANF
jgi:uncharacterized protein (UPF0333 family)